MSRFKAKLEEDRIKITIHVDKNTIQRIEIGVDEANDITSIIKEAYVAYVNKHLSDLHFG